MLWSTLLVKSLEDSNLSWPMGVSVWMLGAASTSDGTSEDLTAIIDPGIFEQTLHSILPFHQPDVYESNSRCGSADDSNTESCDDQGEPSSMLFKMQYTVVTSSSLGVPTALSALESVFRYAYAELIQRSPRNTNGQHEVLVKDVLELLRQLGDGTLPNAGTLRLPVEFLRASAFNIPVIMLATNSAVSPLPPHILRGGSKASIGHSSGVCTNSVVGVIAFYDNTAVPCDLLSELTLTQAAGSADGEGGTSDAMLSLPLGSIHHIRGHLLSYEEEDEAVQREMQRQRSKDHATNSSSAKRSVVTRISSMLGVSAVRSLSTRLCGIVVSAVQSFGTAGRLLSQVDHVRGNTRLLIPVTILRGSNENSKVDEHTSIDTAAIESWLRGLLPPGQDVAVVVHEHWLSEHPQIAVAIAAARSTFLTSASSSGVTETTSGWAVPYYKSSVLLRELTRAADPLCAALLQRAAHGSAADVADWLSGGMVDIDNEGSDSASNVESGGRETNFLLRWLAEQGRAEVEMKNADSTKTPLENITKHAEAEEPIGSTATSNYKSSRAQRGVRVFPIFVLSDVLVEGVGPSADAGVSAGFGSRAGTAVLPLFDMDARIVVHNKAALVMHVQTGADVRVYNRATQRWQRVPRHRTSSDATALVAASLTEALTGVRAPYLQSMRGGLRGRRGVVDLSWGAGAHPFELGDFLTSGSGDMNAADAGTGDIGHVSSRRKGSASNTGSVYSWLGRRSHMAARAQAILREAHRLTASIHDDIHAVLQAMRMLHSDTAHIDHEATSGQSSLLAYSLERSRDGAMRARTPVTDEGFAQALAEFRKQNAQKRKALGIQRDSALSSINSARGVDRKEAELAEMEAAVRADAALELSLTSLVNARNEALHIKKAEAALELALQAQHQRQSAVQKTVNKLRTVSLTTLEAEEAILVDSAHRDQYLKGHLQPYIDVLDTLDGLETTLKSSLQAHAELKRSLREQLASCEVKFQFLDNTHYADLRLPQDAGREHIISTIAQGMSADFDAVLERPERRQPSRQSVGSTRPVGPVRQMWDWLRGLTRRDYKPELSNIQQEQELHARRKEHMDSVSRGFSYSTGDIASTGKLGQKAMHRAGSSGIFAWLRGHPRARTTLLVILLLLLFGVLYYLRRSRIMLAAKKRI